MLYFTKWYMTDYTYQNLNTWNRWKWFIGQ